MSGAPGEVWLRPRTNAAPLVLFVSRGRPRVLAAVVRGEDGGLYLAYSRAVSGVVRELVLSSPLLDGSRPRYLAFECGGRVVRARAYPVRAGPGPELGLLIEEVRFVLSAALDVSVRVRVVGGAERLRELVVEEVPSELGELAGEGGER